jgi:hypothetical protein
MSDFLDKLAEKLVTPENTRKLSTFFNVLQNIVDEPRHSDESSKFSLVKGNKVWISSQGIFIGEDFMQFLGDNQLTIEATTKVESDMNVSLSQAPVQEATGQIIEFVRDGDSYSPKVGSSFLECIEDIHIVNLLKRPKLETNMFKYVQEYFKNKGFQVVIVGETTPLKTVFATSAVPVASAPVSQPVERIVIQEVPVFVNKIVKEEVVVYVDKIVKEQVAVYVNRPIEKQEKPETKPLDKQAPLHEETTSSADDAVGTDSQESSEEEPEESEEPSESPQASEAEQSVRKLKGKFLNPEKTLLRSGDFVYRVNKKINGPSELIAIGRWDTKTQKRVPLQKGDDKIIKKLGHKINA